MKKIDFSLIKALIQEAESLTKEIAIKSDPVDKMVVASKINGLFASVQKEAAALSGDVFQSTNASAVEFLDALSKITGGGSKN